jgi:hypothetical protein
VIKHRKPKKRSRVARRLLGRMVKKRRRLDYPKTPDHETK